jgi:Na+-transporting NADH:ubiquinone oxidoreductase subunit NqrE
MSMDPLRVLPEAAPILLRHLSAYADLIGEDLARAQREMAVRVMTLFCIGGSLVFVLAMACLAVIAETWGTPNRVAAILWMGAAFLGLAVCAFLVRARILRTQSPFLGSVKREWRRDRVALERILSADAG